MGAYFALIPITHKIGAAEDTKIGQPVFNTLGKANGHTLDPTKHPPDDVTTVNSSKFPTRINIEVI
jgi:hypothetical protein